MIDSDHSLYHFTELRKSYMRLKYPLSKFEKQPVIQTPFLGERKHHYTMKSPHQ